MQSLTVGLAEGFDHLAKIVEDEAKSKKQAWILVYMRGRNFLGNVLVKQMEKFMFNVFHCHLVFGWHKLLIKSR